MTLLNKPPLRSCPSYPVQSCIEFMLPGPVPVGGCPAVPKFPLISASGLEELRTVHCDPLLSFWNATQRAQVFVPSTEIKYVLGRLNERTSQMIGPRQKPPTHTRVLGVTTWLPCLCCEGAMLSCVAAYRAPRKINTTLSKMNDLGPLAKWNLSGNLNSNPR